MRKQQKWCQADEGHEGNWGEVHAQDSKKLRSRQLWRRKDREQALCGKSVRVPTAEHCARRHGPGCLPQVAAQKSGPRNCPGHSLASEVQLAVAGYQQSRRYPPHWASISVPARLYRFEHTPEQHSLLVPVVGASGSGSGAAQSSIARSTPFTRQKSRQAPDLPSAPAPPPTLTQMRSGGAQHCESAVQLAGSTQFGMQAPVASHVPVSSSQDASVRGLFTQPVTASYPGRFVASGAQRSSVHSFPSAQ